MNDHLAAVLSSSRSLVGDPSLPAPLKRLATAVEQGAYIIGRHQLEKIYRLTHFGRALFHLCHAVERPMCGRQACCQTAEGNGVGQCRGIAAH